MIGFKKNKAKKVRRLFRKFPIFILTVIFVFVNTFFYTDPTPLIASTAQTRQEINILDGYLGAPASTVATSSEIISIDKTKYSGTVSYYFEIVASTSAAFSNTVSLRRAGTGTDDCTITIPNPTTSYTLIRSSACTLPTGPTDYVVRISSNAGGTTGVKVARVIILQNYPDISVNATSTQTQIEIGNKETGKTNTTSSALSAPKYWKYDSSKWDGTLNFYAEVTYQNTQVSSSTIFRTATTSDTTMRTVTSAGISFLTVEAWGAGGGGGIGTAGGGGGGGGAYAKSVFATTTGSNNTLFIPRGGVTDTAASAGDATFNDTAAGTIDTEVVADGGTGTTNLKGTGGTVANSTGHIEFAGGNGGDGHTTGDVGGGGGGAGGPDGAGVTAAAAIASTPRAGGDGDNGSGGAGGSQGTTNTDTCSTSGGKPGGSNDLGGGGGGGAGSDGTGACSGGTGGAPGGGGGSSEFVNTTQGGGQGQIKLTETYGRVGVAIEEDDGAFGSWTFKQQIVVGGVATSTSARARSASFTPTTGRHYRIVASSTNSDAPYDILNAKIIVDQTSASSFTLLEPQYLLANTSLSSGTSLQNFLTTWDSSEWVGVTNTYVHDVNAADNSTSVVEVDTSGGTLVTGSSVSSPDNRGASGSVTMPANQNLDVKATTNNGDVYSSRILAQVSIDPPAPTVTVASYVNQPTYVAASTTDVVLGVASVVNSSSGTVTAVTINENSGTIDADTELANIELWLSYDSTWDVGDNQLDTAKTFNGVNGDAVFTETFTATTSAQYLIVRGDITSAADAGDTIEIQVKTVASTDSISGTPLEIGGTSTVWNKRMELTFNNSSQAENLTDFPVMVKLNSSKITYADVGNGDGTDLRFVDSNNLTELNYEIEKWDTASDSIIWVKVPQINASSNTDSIWMYYGNPGAASVATTTGVWDSNYVTVYHFNETTGTYTDSTAYGHTSDTPVSLTSRNGAVAGGLGNFPQFAGTDGTSYITIADSADYDFDNHTIEAYVYKTTGGVAISTGSGGATSYPIITKGIGEGETVAADVQFGLGVASCCSTPLTSDFEGFRTSGYASINYPATSTASVSNDAWYYTVSLFDNTNDLHSVFLNGVRDNATNASTTVPNKGGTQKVGIGVGTNTTTTDGGWSGYIDELRISNVVRSDAWIAAGKLSLTDTFVEFPGGDTTAPVISSVASSTAATTATVTWTTDESSDSKVAYGTSAGTYTTSTSSASMVTSHSLGLTGLSTDTLYYYVVVSKDASNNYATSSEYTLRTTADVTAPVISSVASSTAATTATVTWTTDESSDSKVAYGTSAGTYTTSTSSASMVTSHSLGLTGLSADTLYYYVVVSKDASNNYATSSEYTLRTTVDPGEVWWNASWTKRVKITVNNSSRAENLTNFPIGVHLNSSRVTYSDFKAAGADVRFVDADGSTVLDHEIEKWNTTGTSTVWVRVPQVDASSNTDYIYMYYGNSGASDAQNATGVWDSNYVMVYHMDDDPSGSAPQILDSTSNGRHATSTNITATTTGVIGDSLDFGGTDTFVVTASTTIPIVLAAGTVETWFNPDIITGTTSGRYIFSRVKSGTWQGEWRLFGDSANADLLTYKIECGATASTIVAATAPTVGGGWYYSAAVWDKNGGAGNMKLYLNSVLEGTASPACGMEVLGETNSIGRNNALRNGNFDGQIDEFRISSTTRSTNWIGATASSTLDTLLTYTAPESGNDATAPVISSVASSTAATTATVTWTTDESSNSKVAYGTSAGTYTTSTSSASMVTSHSLGLTGLSTDTLYYYVVVSKDAANNYATSSEYTLRTTIDITAPVISSVASTTAATTATVTWTTDESSDSKVAYGTSAGTYTTSTSSASMVTSHSLGLTGLSADTLYYYVVVSKDASNNYATSSEYTLRTAPDGGAWWNASWTKRLKVTIDNSSRAEDLASFPLPVYLNSSRITYGDFKAAGADVRFVDADGSTVLDHEIEKWNTTGTSTVWVEVPQIASASSSDYIYMYYGNSGASDAQNATGVWDSNYVAVYHLDDDPNATAPQVLDSTVNISNSTSTNITATTTGVVGDSLDFGGTDTFVDTASTTIPMPLNAGTVEAWFNPDIITGTSSGRYIFSRVKSGSWQGEWRLFGDSANADKLTYKIDCAAVANTIVAATAPTIGGGWYYSAAVWDKNGGAGNMKLYLNSVEEGTASPTCGMEVLGEASSIGRNNALRNGNFDGQIDEFRVSSTTRTANWLDMTYDSIQDTVIGYGSVESGADTTGPVISSVASSTAATTATVTWTTDESSDSKVAYGTSVGTYTTSTSSASMVTSHSLGLTGLSTDTLYYYVVVSKDSSNNYATSSEYTLRTSPDVTAPVISAVASTTATTTATVTWTTDESSDSKVAYGTSAGTYTTSTSSASLVTSHSLGLTGLSADTFYYYVVVSKDASNNYATSSEYTLQTTNPITFVSPTISHNTSTTSTSITAYASTTRSAPSYFTFRLETSGGALVSQATTSTRYGDFNIDHLSTTTNKSNLALTGDLSGVVYVPTTDTLFTIHNNQNVIHEITRAGVSLRTITCTLCADAEDISLVSSVASSTAGGYDHTFLLSTEDQISNLQIFRVVIHSTGSATVDRTSYYSTGITAPTANNGLEGLAYNSDTGKVYTATEGQDNNTGEPKLYEVTLGDISTHSATSERICTNLNFRDYTTTDSTLFPASPGYADISGLFYEPSVDRLFVLSHMGDKMLEVDVTSTSTCSVIRQKGVFTRADSGSNFLFEMPEGISWDNTGDYIYVGTEADYWSAWQTTSYNVRHTFSGLSSGTYNLYASVTDGGTTSTTSVRTFTVSVETPLAISSASNQVFTIAGSAEGAGTITVTDNSSTPTITAANDLRIAIATSSADMRWLTSVSSGTIGGTASAKVSNSFTYEGGGSVLVIPVNTNFSAGDTLTISGLSFTSFGTVLPATSVLRILKDGASDITSDASDSATVSIKGKYVLGAHSSGQANNKLNTNASSITASEIYQFKLTPTGENISITNMVFNLTEVSGISSGNIANALLYVDYDGDGNVDAGDLAVGGAGSASISGSTGTITFSSSFTATTTRNYILITDISSVSSGDEFSIGLSSSQITSSGVTSIQSITATGFLASKNHRNTGRIGGGGGGGAGSSEETPPASQGNQGGGSQGGSNPGGGTEETPPDPVDQGGGNNGIPPGGGEAYFRGKNSDSVASLWTIVNGLFSKFF